MAGRGKRAEVVQLRASAPDLFDLPVHPLAAIFPMMPDDELADLGADIKTNGQRHPIILGEWQDAKGKTIKGIIEGRNRLRACQLVGVEPKFEQLNGEDPRTVIASENLRRRNLSMGQQAVAHAMIYPDPDPPGRGRKAVVTTGFSRERLSHARTVLREAPDLAAQVLGGASLDSAYKEVMLRQGRQKTQDSRMRSLERERPDLAEQVSAGDLSIEQAEKDAKRDADERKQQRWDTTVNLVNAVAALDREPEMAASVAELFDPAVEEQKGLPPITADSLRRVADYVTALADLWEEGEEA